MVTVVDTVNVPLPKMIEVLQSLDAAQKECERLRKENAALAEQISRQRLRLEKLTIEIAPSLQMMTWEQRRELILTELERDGEYEQQESQRLIDIVAETDRVVADRDRELADLRELLRQRPRLSETLVLGATTIAEQLDTDEIVRLERANLQKLQEEWRQKICQSEIELSLERARLARQTNEHFRGQ